MLGYGAQCKGHIASLRILCSWHCPGTQHISVGSPKADPKGVCKGKCLLRRWFWKALAGDWGSEMRQEGKAAHTGPLISRLLLWAPGVTLLGYLGEVIGPTSCIPPDLGREGEVGEGASIYLPSLMYYIGVKQIRWYLPIILFGILEVMIKTHEFSLPTISPMTAGVEGQALTLGYLTSLQSKPVGMGGNVE